jgi:hypothetical protein
MHVGTEERVCWVEVFAVGDFGESGPPFDEVFAEV